LANLERVVESGFTLPLHGEEAMFTLPLTGREGRFTPPLPCGERVGERGGCQIKRRKIE